LPEQYVEGMHSSRSVQFLRDVGAAES